MKNITGKTLSITSTYFPGASNVPANAADNPPAPPVPHQPAGDEPRVPAQGSSAWLMRQALQQNQAGEPALRRTLSAPPTPAARDMPHAAAGFPPWSAQRMRQGPDLDAMYGSAQPPRAKPGKASGIQKAERGADGMAIVHPRRIVLNRNLTPELPSLLQKVGDELKKGAVYKWTVAKNGQLMLGQSKYPGGEKLGWGHPTLVGGLREPEGRLGGELRYGKLREDDPESCFHINNDSGRYGEYADRNEAMLQNVARRFEELGFPVKEQWMEKPQVDLANEPGRAAPNNAAEQK